MTSVTNIALSAVIAVAIVAVVFGIPMYVSKNDRQLVCFDSDHNVTYTSEWYYRVRSDDDVFRMYPKTFDDPRPVAIYRIKSGELCHIKKLK